MQRSGLGKVTRNLFQRGEIKVKDLHHIFRRSWAYRNLKAGVPLKAAVMSTLGRIQWFPYPTAVAHESERWHPGGNGN